MRVGRLPLAQLVMLIRGARALLFPSLYEGFGLPVLEAMLLGTAVMTSKNSSLIEVAGDAASLVDPYDVSAMARTIAALDADEALRADLSQRGLRQAEKFSPERYRERVDALYQKLLKAV
jgi:glycosyltransferase involved in cell wall biosynthesis